MGKFTVVMPMYGAGQMAAYSVAQLIKCKGRHEVDIIVIDNNSGDGSADYLEPFLGEILIVDYPKGMLQSHGIGQDYILSKGLVKSEFFITMETDSFPIRNDWLDYIESLILRGYEMGGSLLNLSGGSYIHGCGAFYSLKSWQECRKYCDEIEYHYFPNMYHYHGFDSHLMIHDTILETVLHSPEDWIELADNYKGLMREEILAKRDHYKPVVGPFHNGMGNLQETLQTYGQRTTQTEAPNILLNNKIKLVRRVGYEPSQFFYYWHVAMRKKYAIMPTEVVWIEGREHRQQKYTETMNGIYHIWAVSAYKDVDPSDEVAMIKQELPKRLYATLPKDQRIKSEI